ncbi:glycosyl hydrolase family 18 protein [Herbinix luporum]|jgi:spore germination protein YaaH|uniref:glycosyl hydrolase family 18 protein n=1 Tax=Herbinix luporum TaxID=1679721 RepID=UPI00176856AD|nr:glycosyl hydrolase family 18 protein [Herbinix luporum]MDI9487980.1 glycosyl hydrolase family 18 protein [Bacillota bacterium]HHT57365.1 glycosyl hydrolase family 18 [Herbinix luporum]
MDKKNKISIVGMIIAILLIGAGIGVFVIKNMTPSNEVMLLTDYYKVEDTEAIIILQDEIHDKPGIIADGKVYIDLETVVNCFNHRFYWDDNENILTYTTPTEIIQVDGVGNKYFVTKSMIKTEATSDYPILKLYNDDIYIALDFVDQYSDIQYRSYEEPNRVVIDYLWGEYLYTKVTKNTQLRSEPDIKSPLLLQLPVGEELMYVVKEDAPRKGFAKVMTKEGIIGYVRERHVQDSYYKTIESTYEPPEYTSQLRNDKINLVFHQFFNYEAGMKLEELISQTKGVNVVSPTWFDIIDETGEISSLASSEYVEKAKSLGLQVWPLIADVNKEVDMNELLSHTSRREKLSNALIEAAINYKVNGINIDFEKIPSEAGEHYIQFLRELSVKCRNNGIVLSVDNYVPAPYNKHYNLKEQGEILDYVIIMAYDEHYAGSDVAGPVASLGFVSDAVNNTLEEVPKEKVIIAIPFYTRLWKETTDGVSSESLAMASAAKLLEDKGVEPKWNDGYGSHYGEFKQDGAVYKIWLENEKSIEEKMKVIYEADVAGVGAWKLGLEEKKVWDIIGRYLD